MACSARSRPATSAVRVANSRERRPAARARCTVADSRGRGGTGPPQPGGTRVAAVLSDRTRERALERMRADFVANASHELRTPLASLIGFIDTLRGPAADDPPAQARFLQIMAEQAGRMNRLIDDLLSLSRIEMTEHQPPSGRVMLADLVRWVVASFEPQITARRIKIELSLSPDLPPVPGDKDQLTQVLHNLLENAVKYGREGGTVRVAADPVPAGGRWPARPGVTLAVTDDGHGAGHSQATGHWRGLSVGPVANQPYPC